MVIYVLSKTLLFPTTYAPVSYLTTDCINSRQQLYIIVIATVYMYLSRSFHAMKITVRFKTKVVKW